MIIKYLNSGQGGIIKFEIIISQTSLILFESWLNIPVSHFPESEAKIPDPFLEGELKVKASTIFNLLYNKKGESTEFYKKFLDAIGKYFNYDRHTAHQKREAESLP